MTSAVEDFEQVEVLFVGYGGRVVLKMRFDVSAISGQKSLLYVAGWFGGLRQVVTRVVFLESDKQVLDAEQASVSAYREQFTLFFR